MRGMKVHQRHNRNMSYSVKGNIAQSAGKFEVYFRRYYNVFVELMQFNHDTPTCPHPAPNQLMLLH